MRFSFRRSMPHSWHFAWLLAIASLFACMQHGNAAAAHFERSACWFKVPRDREMTCGHVSVPESRNSSSGKSISLAVVVFEPDRARHDPVVFLTGGPGQTAGIESREDIDNWWHFIGEQPWMIGRRLVVVDQRGIGMSEPALDCSRFFKPEHWDHAVGLVGQQPDFSNLEKEDVAACRDSLVAGGVDLKAYNTAENAADIDDLRSALGIKKWVLYGVSYGTEVALVSMDQHPDGISASILDSVLPPDVEYLRHDGRNLTRVLEILDRDCQKMLHCMTGETRLAAAVETISRQLDRQPVLLRSDGKISDSAVYKYVSGDDFLEILFNAFYQRDGIEMLPLLIQKTYEHNFQMLTSFAFDDEDGSADIFDGMDYSVTCTESNTERPPLAAGYFTKWAGKSDYTWTCPLWLPGKATVRPYHPRRSGIPTLLLSGEYDPATPPAWAGHAARNLPAGQTVVFRGLGHDVIDSDPCAGEVVADFLADPQHKVKTACMAEMGAPKFATEGGGDLLAPASADRTAAMRQASQAQISTRRSARRRVAFPTGLAERLEE